MELLFFCIAIVLANVGVGYALWVKWRKVTVLHTEAAKLARQNQLLVKKEKQVARQAEHVAQEFRLTIHRLVGLAEICAEEEGAATAPIIKMAQRLTFRPPGERVSYPSKEEFLARVEVAQALEKVTDDLNEVESQVTEKLAEKGREISKVYENVGEGILMFGDDLIVASRYSLFLEKIFPQRKIHGENVLELIFRGTQAGEAKQRQVLSTLIAVFGEAEYVFLANQHLLPKEMRYTPVALPGAELGSAMVVLLAFEPILGRGNVVERVLLVIHDVTEITSLREQAYAHETRLLLLSKMTKLPAGVLLLRLGTCLELVSGNLELCDGWNLSQSDGWQDREAILRGNLALLRAHANDLGMLHLVSQVHRVEGFLREGQPLADYVGQLQDCHKTLQAMIRDDMDFVQRIRGPSVTDGLGDFGVNLSEDEMVAKIDELIVALGQRPAA